MKSKQFLVVPGRKLRLKDRDPGDTGGYADEAAAASKIETDCSLISELQDKLMAQSSHGLLLVFQAMDGSAKDGTIKYIMSATDPQGCTAHNFKPPGEEETKQDYLQRFHACIPARGRIGVFNRSYYEEVLVTRVHPEILADEHLPGSAPKGKRLWRQRFAQINSFEQYLVENGILVMKFFLHISKDKQRERLLERIEEPEKRWKFSPSDVEERGHWGAYMRAYEDALTNTSTNHAPWYVIPANNRWFAALAVADLVAAKLKELKLRYPGAKGEEKKEMAEAKKKLARDT